MIRGPMAMLGITRPAKLGLGQTHIQEAGSIYRPQGATHKVGEKANDKKDPLANVQAENAQLKAQLEEAQYRINDLVEASNQHTDIVEGMHGPGMRFDPLTGSTYFGKARPEDGGGGGVGGTYCEVRINGAPVLVVEIESKAQYVDINIDEETAIVVDGLAPAGDANHEYRQLHDGTRQRQYGDIHLTKVFG